MTMDLYEYEQSIRSNGFQQIVGVDEVGRGPLAGPVVAAAVSIPENCHIAGLNDSKKLSPEKRNRIYSELTNTAGIQIGVSEITCTIIDQINILKATHLAMRSALLKIDSEFDLVLVDGLPVPNLPSPSQNIIKGDSKCASIAAASIIAKVHRDKIMVEYDKEFPVYGFRKHKGYGTKAHLISLSAHGPCPIHRMSFAPISRIINPPQRQEIFPFKLEEVDYLKQPKSCK